MQILGQFNSQYGRLFTETNENEDVVISAYVKHWGWIINLDMISNGNRLDWKHYEEMNCTQLMNYIAYRRDKADLENYLIKNANRK